MKIVDEILALLHAHEKVLQLPKLTNIRKAIEARLQEIEESHAPEQKPEPTVLRSKPQAIPAAEPETQFTSDTPEIDRRV